MKKLLCILLTFLLLTGSAFATEELFTDIVPIAEGAVETAGPVLDIPVSSCILIEKDSGKILYEKNANEKLPPASVTKIMTVLLVMEAIESGQLTLDMQIEASEHASQMGGSQIYLKPGEVFSVDDLLKAVVVASANDAAVMLAEAVSGSEESFVAKMNERAKELGMTNTNFVNVCGLDVDGHLTTAHDIALMSAELLRHPLIKNYSKIWTDTLREGTFGLTNTNKLVRSYNGITGLKTGFTSKAMYCLSATAERDGMELIAVVMGAHNSAVRFDSAAKLLNYGYANYAVYRPEVPEEDLSVPVIMGTEPAVSGHIEDMKPLVLEKGKTAGITPQLILFENVKAPVVKGQKIGELILKADGEILVRENVVAVKDVPKESFFGIFTKLLKVASLAS